jgi:hypothetical protein
MSSSKAFNCEIVNISCNLGFGASESSVNLTLVECGTPYDGSLGCVYTINVGGFNFTGVLADHTYQQSSSGLVWTVRLTDGRQSLTNVSVILNDYYCNIDTPNLINVLALLEPSICEFSCSDFMASLKDDTGILMLYILRALNGQSCLLPVCGVTLNIDLSQVIDICPAYLKINDTHSNVLNIIDQACQEAGYDFFIQIEGSSFVAVPISKKVAPPSGALQTLLNTISASNCGGEANIDFRYGEEAAYEPSKKFVIGENIHYLMQIDKAGDCDNKPNDGTIGGVPDTGVIDDPVVTGLALTPLPEYKGD